jgi:hypothetical protein
MALVPLSHIGIEAHRTPARLSDMWFWERLQHGIADAGKTGAVAARHQSSCWWRIGSLGK